MHQFFEPSKMTTMDGYLDMILITKNDDYLIVTYKSKTNSFMDLQITTQYGSNKCDVVLFFKKDNWVWVVYAKPCLTSSKI
jgi:hypothetical protein